MTSPTEPIKTRTIIGLALILIAVLMLLRNIGLPFFGSILGHWPVGLIIIGGVLLYAAHRSEGRQKPNQALAYFLIGLGVLFSLAKYRFLHISLSAVIVPLILFLIGVSILRPDRRASKPEPVDTHKGTLPATTGPATASAQDVREKVDVFTVLGGGDYNTRSQYLTSGNIVCILGGADIDLRDADTQEDNLRIEVLAIMGGAELKVPPHWQVIVDVVPFLGGVSNKTTCLADKMQVAKKQLTITGFAFMGGIDIRN